MRTAEHHAVADVLYLGGMGRSGSTLVSSILGGLPGFHPVGELRGLWNAIEADELCGCGFPFSECPFWQAVGKRAFSGWGHVDVQRMRFLDRKLLRQRRLPALLLPGAAPWVRKEFEMHVETLGNLYTAVRETAGCSVIVESSKVATYALLLNQAPELRVEVVHLVRDSRAVAFSWGRTVDRPEYARNPTLHGTPMATYGAAAAAVLWLMENAAFHALEMRGVSAALVRYEDFVERPEAETRRILASLRFDVEQNVLREDGHYEAKRFHTIGGSRVRFKSGLVEIREDDEWRTAMSQTRRLLVTLLTLPLLRSYKYL